MNLADVMDEIATVMTGLTKVNVHAYPASGITPDAGVVGYPDSIDFDQTYGRGVDQIAGIPIWLVTSKVTDLTARDKVAKWAAGSGQDSIKARMDAHAWTSCDDLTVTAATFSTVTIGGQDYLAVIFEATATGPGRA